MGSIYVGNRSQIPRYRMLTLMRRGGIPTFNFNTALATFTPRMAKRTAPGPFATAPIVQGVQAATTGPDILTIANSTEIVTPAFHAQFDWWQGTICLWYTPELAPANVARYLVNAGALDFFYLNGNLRFRIRQSDGTKPEIIKAVTLTAGTTYFIAARWDLDNTLDGTNLACISVDDSHTFGMTAYGTYVETGATIDVGVEASGANEQACNGLIEGLTIYRRVLSDGTYGVPATPGGDELALIYASGSGKKPEEVCPEDIVFALPTNGTVAELATGTGEAWSFPWSDNKLTNWHFQTDTVDGTPDDWTAVNAPTLADAATADILFGTRSQKISVDAADEGIKQAFSVIAGEDYFIGAWVKTAGAGNGIDIRVYDATGAADVLELTTDSTDWVFLSGCFEAPAGCSSIEVYVESTDAATYDMHVAQVVVLQNLVDNGGMEGTYDDESGGGGGTVNLAPGWNNLSAETDGTDTLDESATAHSGSKSQQVNVNANGEGINTASSGVFPTLGNWYLVTAWLYGTSGSVLIQSSAGSFSTIVTPAVGSWTRYSFVTNLASGRLYFRASGGAANFLVDDVSVVELDDVSITATAANEASSTEGTGLRVDGLDTLTQTIKGLSASSGKITFSEYTPRHSAADVAKLGLTTPYIFEAYGDADDYIRVYWSAANTITLAYNAGGAGEQTDTYDATGAIVAGTSYELTVEYSATQMVLSIDGTPVITITAAVAFATVPATMYAGTNQAGANQADAVFG